MEVSNDILDFLTGIHGVRGKEEECKRKEKIFNRAFELAYKDMATHTVAYTKDAKDNYANNDSKRCNENKIKIRNSIKQFVKTRIFGDNWSNLLEQIKSQDAEEAQKAFNNWHQRGCESIAEIGNNINFEVEELINKENGKDNVKISALLCHVDKDIADEIDGVFTIGQAQKLINMMVKYLYIYYQCEGCSDSENLKKFAHVPIDSYVLNKVLGNNHGDTPWSKIVSYEKYNEYKDKIDEEAKGYCSPFLWELANWPFGNEEA